MTPSATVNGRHIGPGYPVYVIAEVSANHNGSLDRALEIISAAADAGADAVKFQTYSADSLTIDSDAPSFRIGGGTLWDGQRLYDLYQAAATPSEWMPAMFERARSAGIDAFSTPFDEAALTLLEDLDPPAHKVASFELVDLELLRAVGSTARPVIASTGMATVEEIDRAVAALRESGTTDLVLLRCNSAYPAPTDEMDLRSIADMQVRWDVPVGLSDHTLSDTAAVVAVALGACVLEKHLTLARTDGGPDSGFSLEPDELRQLVSTIREAESALGSIRYGASPSELPSLVFRRSLFIIKDIAAGQMITKEHVRSIRPGFGLSPHLLGEVLGRRARGDLQRGTPLSWELLE